MQSGKAGSQNGSHYTESTYVGMNDTKMCVDAKLDKTFDKFIDNTNNHT